LADGDYFVGVVGASIVVVVVVDIAGVVEEVDVGPEVVQAVNFGGVVGVLVVGVVAAAAADVAVAGPAVGKLSVHVVVGVGLGAGGVKVVDIVGAGNLSRVAEGFAVVVVVVEQEMAIGTAVVAAAAEFDTFVRMNMSAGVDDAVAALATPWLVAVLAEVEVGSVADGRYVGFVGWDEGDDRRLKRR